MFTQKFSKYVCQGDTIETDIDGLTITARIEYDESHHIDDDDCHNIDRKVTGCTAKQQKKLIEVRMTLPQR